MNFFGYVSAYLLLICVIIVSWKATWSIIDDGHNRQRD
jgi:hypothetical protein